MIVFCDGILLAERIDVADSFSKRLLGLLGRKELGEGEGLFLKNCSSIHCFFMKFPIDVVYLSKEMKVLQVESIKPWRIGSLIGQARHVLELPEGAARGIRPGTVIEIREFVGQTDGSLRV